MYSCVLVPLDGSALAAQVLPYAEMVAKSTGATVLLLRVMNPYPGELGARRDENVPRVP